MKGRAAIAGLAMSAAAFGTWIAYEGWAPVATVPIPGDVPTYGYGLTTRPDGSPVKLGDTITRPQATRQVWAAADGYQRALRNCFGNVALYQHEWDAYILLAKNVGPGAVCRSSIVRKLKVSDYSAACSTILDFAGIRRDGVRLSCADRANGCYGVWRARLAEYRMCLNGEY